GSNPVNGPFKWEQMVTPGQPIVTIINPNAPIATFVAPVVASPTSLTFRLTVGGNNTTIAGFANVIVPIDAAAPNTPIAVTATSTPINPVASGAAVTLTASAISPAGGNVTFTWAAPAGIVLTPAAADGSVQTFTAPIVPTLAGPSSF